MTAVVSIRPTGTLSTVDFDDGSSIRCTREFAQRSRIERGQQIDPVFIDRLRESASHDLALHEAHRLAARQRYSRQEIAVKLQMAGIAKQDVDTALDTLEAQGNLSDYAVALEIARRSLRLTLERDPDLTWARYRRLHTRRLSLRGFGMADTDASLRQAWSELE